MGCRRRAPAWLVATSVACTGPVERSGVDAEATSHERSEETLSREQLLDPVACQACHPAQYEEWSGSMHAYASRDPVFLAMNARGQEETGGKLGDFCVQCHAPMAVRDGLTSNGLNMADLPNAYQGVTCYFCHNAEAVEGDHNNPVRLANDTVMRGPFRDPVATAGHPSSYSTHFDKDHADSAALCGACHDVLVHEAFAPANVALERTYLEWQASLFSAPTANGGLTCNGCHMPISPRRDQAASGDHMPKRASRRHDFEGVDVALDDFPGKTRQRLLVQQFLDSSLLAEICVSRDGVIAIAIENASAGHHWPSGASHDRLLRLVRKELRRRYGYPSEASREPFRVRAVYSEENARFPWSDGSVRTDPEPGATRRINCATGFGSATPVTGTFGFAAAAEAIRAIIGSAEEGEAGERASA